MIRIFVTLVIVAALGHVVNSRLPNITIEMTSLLGTNNNNNGTSYIPPNLLNPIPLSGALPFLGGQKHTTAPSADRKKGKRDVTFQNLIPKFIPSKFIPTGTEQDSTTTEKPSAN